MGVADDFYTDQVIPNVLFPPPEPFQEAQNMLAASNEGIHQFDVAQMLVAGLVQSFRDRVGDR